MGMAASQARYLALVARKSNCEFEGQQINQARLNLSNQSANLFNQMLGLNVPTPPSTQDYTKVQYSFSDGVNNVTMDSWKQLGTSDENYNYVVTYHYNSNVYTGAQKKMNDPQVQFSTVGTSTDINALKAATSRLTSTSSAYSKIQEDYDKLKANLESAKKAATEADDAYNIAKTAMQKAEAERDAALQAYRQAQTARSDYENSSDYQTIKTNYENANTKLNNEKTAAATLANYSSGSTQGSSTKISKDGNNYVINNTTYKAYDEIENEEQRTAIREAINKLTEEGALDIGFSTANVYYDETTNSIAFAKDIENAVTKTTDTDIPLYTTGEAGSILTKASEYDTNIASYTADLNQAKLSYDAASAQLQELSDAESKAKSTADLAESTLTEANKTLVSTYSTKLTTDANLTSAQTALDEFEATNKTTIEEYNAAKEAYDGLQTPEYIGNCKLTLLETLTSDQEAELKQVVQDMKAQGIDADINNCFDEDSNYIGGVYQFTLNGKTYYSSLEGLYNSNNSGTGPNHIDGQSSLAYYNASYVSTKIEDTKKALLETDSNGRFTSIRLEDDTIQFTLNAETITDDAAYQDAMNQYYYENAQYDKMVQDINAKTSLIQQEDQQLELRLKQLDTEQNALSTEIDAVSKVVKDNVEKSFKTFGG